MILLLAALTLAPAPTSGAQGKAAFFYTGLTLQNTCGKDDDLSLGLCVGYIDSALDRILFDGTFQRPRRICVSSHVTNDMLRASVRQQLAKQQGDLGLPAFTYVEKAVADGWACPGAVSGK